MSQCFQPRRLDLSGFLSSRGLGQRQTSRWGLSVEILVKRKLIMVVPVGLVLSSDTLTSRVRLVSLMSLLPVRYWLFSPEHYIRVSSVHPSQLQFSDSFRLIVQGRRWVDIIIPTKKGSDGSLHCRDCYRSHRHEWSKCLTCQFTTKSKRAVNRRIPVFTVNIKERRPPLPCPFSGLAKVFSFRVVERS